MCECVRVDQITMRVSAGTTNIILYCIICGMAISAGDPGIQQKEKKNEIKFAFIYTRLAYVCNKTLIGSGEVNWRLK